MSQLVFIWIIIATFNVTTSASSVLQPLHIAQIAPEATSNESQLSQQFPKGDTETAQCETPSRSSVDPSCWNTLSMSQYTRRWWATNQKQCDTHSNFSACFWEMHGLASMDCTAIQPSTCSFPMSANLTAQDYYIAYNIYGINQVFNSYWRGIGNANSIAAETIGAIVQVIHPPRKTHVHLDEVLVALGIGLQFLNIWSLAGLIKGIIIANQQSPQVFKNLLPTGTMNSQIAQMIDLSSSLSGVVEQYQQNIADSVPLIVNDVETFINFASTGNFQINPLPDISSASDQLLTGLRTFVISRALTANNIIITRANNTNIASLAQNPNNGLSYTTGCEKGYDSNGFCGPFWYDHTTNTTYSLDNLGDMRDDFASIRQQIFSNWTTPELLYRGAAECNGMGGSSGLLDHYLILGYTINTACLSNTKVCSWDLNSDSAEHEFTDCPSQNGYLVNGCVGEDNGVNVPSGYVGPYLTDPPSLDQVCIH